MIIIKMPLLAIFLFSIMCDKSNTSLKPNNFCILNKNTYKNAICKNHQCLLDMCTNKKVDCEQFKSWTSLLDRYRNEKSLKLYSTFMGEIKDCTSNKYVSLKSEICLNKIKTPDKWSGFQGKGVIHVRFNSDSCNRKKMTDCGETYCRNSKRICDVILINMKLYNLKNIAICKY